jgi:hypothetical protein
VRHFRNNLNKTRHSILKKPNKNEFIISYQNRSKYYPEKQLLEFCNQIINVIKKNIFSNKIESLLYTRIDLFYDETLKEFLVSEVELIEPFLYLQWGENSHKFFGDEIIKLID